jgi:hemerythrin-like domain-containing protein
MILETLRLVKKILAILQNTDKDKESLMVILVDNSRFLIEFLKLHMDKENNFLYQMDRPVFMTVSKKKYGKR